MIPSPHLNSGLQVLARLAFGNLDAFAAVAAAFAVTGIEMQNEVECEASLSIEPFRKAIN